MDLVSAWKATSIVFTGAFGILGLLRDFRDRTTNKVTVWGRISLAGILVSTALGVAAQLKETSDQEHTRLQTANQALALAKNTDKAVKDIQRSLSPLTPPRISIDLVVPCTVPWATAPCNNPALPTKDREILLKAFPFEFPVYLDLFKDQASADRYESKLSFDSDVRVEGNFDSSSSDFVFGPRLKDVWTIPAKELKLSASTTKSEITSNSGMIESILDLPGITAIVVVPLLGREDFVLSRICLLFPNGRRAGTAANIKRIERYSYRYVFPDFEKAGRDC
jgi:hypothetical protein